MTGMEGGDDETIEGSKIRLMCGGRGIAWVFAWANTHDHSANGEIKFRFTDKMCICIPYVFVGAKKNTTNKNGL